MVETLSKWLEEGAIIPKGKILCCITGKLRKNTAHERVRQWVAKKLVNEYKYSLKDMQPETYVVVK